MNDYYLISLEVKYEPDATGAQRSLGRVAPELVHADLALAEDDDVREWTGGIDSDTYARLADGWGLDERLARYRHVFDGMEFEEGGFSPIVWVTLSVRLPPKTSSAGRIVGNRRQIVRPHLTSA